MLPMKCKSSPAWVSCHARRLPTEAFPAVFVRESQKPRVLGRFGVDWMELILDCGQDNERDGASAAAKEYGLYATRNERKLRLVSSSEHTRAARDKCFGGNRESHSWGLQVRLVPVPGACISSARKPAFAKKVSSLQEDKRVRGPGAWYGYHYAALGDAQHWQPDGSPRTNQLPVGKLVVTSCHDSRIHALDSRAFQAWRWPYAPDKRLPCVYVDEHTPTRTSSANSARIAHRL